MNRKYFVRGVALAVTMFLASAALAVSQGVSEYPEVSGDDLRWQIEAEHGRAELRVVRPDGKVVVRSVPAGAQEIAFSPGANDQPEGAYLWEISLAPQLTEDQRSELKLARREGVELATEADLQGWRTHGSFRIIGGRIHGVSGDLPKESSAVERSDGGAVTPMADPVAGDLTVRSSLCVGTDCADNEAYGFDTVRLREDNLRIAFLDDSDPGGGFPAGDWQVRINESTNGGADFFAVEWLGDASDGSANNAPVSTPLRIDGGAPGNALHIAGSGNIGFGTPSPVVELHLRVGDTPALRLEQDDSSGFAAQTWDVAGNETNFFVRDATNGSALPFRIRPGAATSALVISNDSSVGVGTLSPEARLHVAGDARIDGALFQLSSRAAKTDFAPPEASALLEKIEKLDLGFWRYKGRAEAARHFGPTAEDFHAAFGLGDHERHISVSDMAGIALGAAQALQQEIRRRDETIADLTQRLERLEAALDAAPAR